MKPADRVGNPDNGKGYKTAYLWEQVWQRDSMLDILPRVIHLQVAECTFAGEKVRKEGSKGDCPNAERCTAAAMKGNRSVQKPTKENLGDMLVHRFLGVVPFAALAYRTAREGRP